MSAAVRFGFYWLGFSVLFIALQLVIADERPDRFGIAVLVVFALPLAAAVNWIQRRNG